MALSNLHATLIALDEKGLLLKGPSGAGKSDLALRLITLPIIEPWLEVPPQLVADDQVVLEKRDNKLFGHPPETLKGLLEVRGLGILSLPYRAEVEIVGVIELGEGEKRQRLPETPLETISLEGVAIPLLRLDPFEASAAVKLVMAANVLL